MWNFSLRRTGQAGRNTPFDAALTIMFHRLAFEAMLEVFQRRQTKLKVVVKWLRVRLSQMDEKMRKEKGRTGV